MTTLKQRYSIETYQQSKEGQACPRRVCGEVSGNPVPDTILDVPADAGVPLLPVGWEETKEDDWLGDLIRCPQRSGLHGLSPQPAGPAPHEAFHWLASTVLAIFRVLSARFIYAMDPRPTLPQLLAVLSVLLQ